MFYSDEQIQNLNKNTKKYVIISSIVLGLCIASFVVSLFFLSDASIKLIQVLVSITLSLAVCFFIYVIINVVLSNKRRIALIKNILSGEETSYVCEVRNIGKLRTINHNIKAYDIEIKVDGKIITVLLDSEIDTLLEKGPANLKVRNKYIVEINK